MGASLLGRLAQGALVVLFVVATCFALIRLAPGDPFFRALDEASVPAEVRAAQLARFGYDRPIPEQFARYLGTVVRGDLGWSHSRGQPVAQAIATALPATLLLVGTAGLLAFVVGVSLGAWSGWHADRPIARGIDRGAMLLLSIPDYLLALLAVMGPALAWGLFPVGGARTEFGPTGLLGLVDRLHHLVLPVLALALPIAAVVTRLQHAAMRDVRDAAFIRTARANGVPERRIRWRHALRNALVPVLSYGGVQVAAALSGVVVIERIFAWPGMGRLLYDGVLSRDYPLIAGGVLVAAIGTVLGTMVADLAIRWADPRQRNA
jgi:peptide/nickel transport system permease protein